jgi:hypothetical protein
MSKTQPYTLEPVDAPILTLRRQKVILDSDLARIYGVSTKRLNEQVRRNADRFPPDFMIRLTREEAQEIRRSRSQFATLKRGQNIKYLPFAFTEHGAIMAATVLNSPQAVQMSVFVVRAFVRLRQSLADYAELQRRLDELEKRYDAQFSALFEAIRELMTPPDPPRKEIGFQVRERRVQYGTEKKR